MIPMYTSDVLYHNIIKDAGDASADRIGRPYGCERNGWMRPDVLQIGVKRARSGAMPRWVTPWELYGSGRCIGGKDGRPIGNLTDASEAAEFGSVYFTPELSVPGQPYGCERSGRIRPGVLHPEVKRARPYGCERSGWIQPDVLLLGVKRAQSGAMTGWVTPWEPYGCERSGWIQPGVPHLGVKRPGRVQCQDGFTDAGNASAGRTGDPLESRRVAPFFANFPSQLFYLEDFPSAFVYSLTDVSKASGFGTMFFTPELSVPGQVQCQDGFTNADDASAGRMGDPLGSHRVAPFFADFPSRLLFLEDFSSTFVNSLTDASQAAGFGPMYFTPELSVPDRVQCQDCLTDASEAAVFGPVYFTPELSVPVLCNARMGDPLETLRMRAMHRRGRTGDPLGSRRVAIFFIDFPSRLFFLDDFPSAFVYSLTDASEAAGFGTVYFTPELSVPGLVQCQDG
ncbi:hypothetical protein Acr_07g0000800 [Actinidia rufa]|uniref:Uncharacterized protein n=1 Tax=Actinidia rufa TaxID=165716 RepID=A0A7J0ETY7_9ERIC|nr:hypothetical protein Acr_07g0000800 [Actinidia rufa]